MHVAHAWDRKGACRTLVGKSVGNRRLGRPGRRWEDNIEINIQEVEWRFILS
jgi:hypothetical protein